MKPRQFAVEVGPPIGDDWVPREPAIHFGRAARVPSVCSCCHGVAPEGVYAHTRRDRPSDPAHDGHVYLCLDCAERFGREAAKGRRP